MNWPGGKRFAFSIVDDTDRASVASVKPVYDLLEKLGLKTTKTVWVYPSRDGHVAESLADPGYLEFVRGLKRKGFEVALHGVGSGAFDRDEIRQGLELFRTYFGEYPTIHTNHRMNPDNLFWGDRRFAKPLSAAIRLIYGGRRTFHGDDPNSRHYWGDLCREHVRYIRNYVFKGIVTSDYDPYGPYRVANKADCSNYWFSSSNGASCKTFTRLLTRRNIDRLVRSGGYSIVYTHFASGFVDSSGRVDQEFESRLRLLAAQGGWFVPASTLLDHLRTRNEAEEPLSLAAQQRLDALWLRDRTVMAFAKQMEQLARRVNRHLRRNRGEKEMAGRRVPSCQRVN